jgi:hypothetical protein
MFGTLFNLSAYSPHLYYWPFFFFLVEIKRIGFRNLKNNTLKEKLKFSWSTFFVENIVFNGSGWRNKNLMTFTWSNIDLFNLSFLGSGSTISSQQMSRRTLKKKERQWQLPILGAAYSQKYFLSYSLILCLNLTIIGPLLESIFTEKNYIL